MSKLTLIDLANLQNETTAVTAINVNNTSIEEAVENTLSRDGQFPNQMLSTLDMNSNRIINLPAPTSSTEPLRQAEITNYLTALQTIIENTGAGNATVASITQFGAVGNGTTNNTTAIQTAVNSGIQGLYIPSGTFLVGHIDLPTTINYIFGPGTLLSTGLLNSFQAWFRSANALNLTVDGVSFFANALDDSSGILDLINATNCRVNNCRFSGGRFCLQIEASSHTIISNCEFATFSQSAIEATGSNIQLFVLNNNVAADSTTSTSINVGEATFDSSDCSIIGNHIFSPGGWGIHVHDMHRGNIALNIIRESTPEAITVGGLSERVNVSNNIAFWQGAGTDVGMSCQGDDSSRKCTETTFRDNTIIRPWGAGILVAGFCEDTLVIGNHLLDINRSGATLGSGHDAWLGGVSMIDAACLRTTVLNNLVTNIDGGHAAYAVIETGGADYSYIANNYGRSILTSMVLAPGAHSVSTNNIALP